MNLFSGHFSLRGKLIFVIMLCCTLALLLNNLFIFSVETLEFKKSKVLRLFILADVIANNSTAALKFADNEVAQETLGFAVADITIHHAILLNEECLLFAEYETKTENFEHDLLKKLFCSRTPSHFYTSDYLYLSTPVIFEDQQIGSLFIKSSLIDGYSKLTRQLKFFSLLFLATLLIAFLLTLKLQTYFLAPIKNLLSAIRHISEHKDYSIQVQSYTHDELTLLADEFNAMIAKIHLHDQLLSNQNLLLEQTVEQRTQQLLTNLQQLKLAKETAENADRAKSDFLAHMSHDLRTPLNGLLGYVQILQRKQDFPEKYLNEIKIIGQSGEYLLSLINDLLDLTKIESNKLELTLHTFNTTEFLTSIVDMFTNQAQKKHLKFHYQVESKLPLTLFGDENRLRRILSNLLDNACKFSEQGSINFTVSYENGQIIFFIEDSGCGIDESNLQAIYEPFNQFSRITNNDGVGLGLYITQYLVNLMQGNLSIKSQLNQGTQCQLNLPLPARQYVAPEFNKYESVSGYQGNVKTVLLVDDNISNLTILEALLSPLGFKVVSVNSGLACLDKLQTLTVDIILLDMIMPTFNGLETCERIHQLELSPPPKVVMITANAFAEDRANCMTAGCDDFLAKPVLLNQLLEIFGQQLNIQWLYQKSPTVNKSTLPLKLLRVLVADDDQICKLLIENNLKEIGINVAFAKDGNQALRMIQNTTYDCIILDIKMPYKTGIEIANHINNHETPNSHSYIVIMSALTTDEIKNSTSETSFDAVLNKPIDLKDLKDLLDKASKKAVITESQNDNTISS